jgi:hypothetical protein
LFARRCGVRHHLCAPPANAAAGPRSKRLALQKSLSPRQDTSHSDPRLAQKWTCESTAQAARCVSADKIHVAVRYKQIYRGPGRRVSQLRSGKAASPVSQIHSGQRKKEVPQHATNPHREFSSLVEAQRKQHGAHSQRRRRPEVTALGAKLMNSL